MPELNERVSDKYVADMLAHPARRTLIGENELASILAELQQRRASVVTPEELAKIIDPIAWSQTCPNGWRGRQRVALEKASRIAALPVVSHETGDGEPKATHTCTCWACAGAPAPTDETQGVERANSPPSKPLPDFDRLHGLFSYHAETGKIIWEVPFKAIVAGDEAGSVWNDGYRYIRLDGRAYLAHRIAWLMHYGEAPKRALDHINGVKSDNRISNLRQATIAENNRNRPRPRNNTSGHKGVTLNRATGKFMARIGHNRAVHSLGYFDTAAEAAAAYAAKAKELHGEFHHDQ